LFQEARMRDNGVDVSGETRPEGSDALAILRTIDGRKAKEVAPALGLSPSSYSDYERGDSAPSRKLLGRFSALIELPEYFVDRVLGLIREARAAIAARRSPTDRLAAARQAIERRASDGAVATYGFIRGSLTQLSAQAAAEEGRRRAREVWELFAPVPTARARQLMAEIPEVKTWELCERVCDESVRAARHDAGKAVELAELALWIASGVESEHVPRPRIQGRAWAFVGNARRVQGDLRAADEAFLRSRKLCRQGAGGPELLDPSRELDLEASLRRAERRLPEAFALLDRALAVSPGPASSGRILVKKAKTQEVGGDYEAALATLDQAEPAVAAAGDPHLVFALRFNVLVNLGHLRRAAEAERMLPEVRGLALALGNGLDLVHLRCLEGEIAAELGRTEEAIALLMSARAEFASRGIAYDMALVSLKLAELYAAQGKQDMVKALARQMVAVFQEQSVHSEAKKALAFFRRAAEQDAVDARLARRLVEYLQRARHDPELRFEAA
jgi:tetratricopeptide (TPR) repeat protein/transcriptional regulator with XRE-family HTH domain